MSDARTPLTHGSIARVLWAVGVMETPTAAEIADELDLTRSHTQNQLRALFRSELVARRKRPGEGKGPREYEYAIRVPDTNE